MNPSSVPLDLGRGAPVDAMVAGYQVHGVPLIVRADDQEILDRVHDTYGWFADERMVGADAADEPTAEPTPGGTTPTRSGAVEIAYRSRADGGATIIDAAGRAVELTVADEPLVALFDAIVSGLISGLASAGILAVHAGVVIIDGRAVVIAGRSGRGKTTLVLELLRRGATFMSDELALVAADDRTVLAYPRGVHLRRSALGLFPELSDLAAAPSHALGGGSEWSVGPAALERAFGASVTAEAPLGAVILLDGDPAPEAEPELAWVPGAMAAMELLRGTPAAAWDFDGVLARLPRVIADVPCARLRSARLGPTAAAIAAWATASFADTR